MTADADDAVTAAKAALRHQVRTTGATRAAATRRAASDSVCTRLLELDEMRKAAEILCYRAMGHEIDVDDAAGALRRRGQRTSYPRVAGGRLEVVAVDDTTAFAPGFRGLAEPVGPAQVAPALDVVLVPGVAFDALGHRLGHGLGFYDRFLATVSATRIAIAFDEQIVEHVPTEAFDVGMHAIVTPTRTLRC